MAPPKRILLVDDDKGFRDILFATLKQVGYQADVAVDGKQACQMLGLHEYSLVITDIRMPHMSGVDLLRWIRKENIKTPVVLMTGFSAVTETTEASELGAAGFLAKPFKRADLMGLLDTLAPTAASQKVTKAEDQGFFRLGIQDFISGSTIRQDIYIRLSESKYVKIAHSGEDLPPELIRKYQNKGVKFLYLLREDFKKYLDQSILMVKAARKIPLPPAKTAALLKHTSEVVVQNLYNVELEEEAFEQSKELASLICDGMATDNDTFSLLEALRGHSDELYAHSVGVAIYGTMIARHMGWRSFTTQIKLCLGGLFHDIGKKELDKEMLLKPRHQRSAEETRLYETHPARGAAILMDIKKVPGDVIQIAQQHHENILGSGFPAHLRRSAIHPLARLISLANSFCDHLLKGQARVAITPREAANLIVQHESAYFEPGMIEALLRVCTFNDNDMKAAQEVAAREQKRSAFQQ